MTKAPKVQLHYSVLREALMDQSQPWPLMRWLLKMSRVFTQRMLSISIYGFYTVWPDLDMINDGSLRFSYFMISMKLLVKQNNARPMYYWHWNILIISICVYATCSTFSHWRLVKNREAESTLALARRRMGSLFCLTRNASSTVHKKLSLNLWNISIKSGIVNMNGFHF